MAKVLDTTDTARFLDPDTGELIDAKIELKSNTIRNDEPQYVKIYINAWVAVYAGGARVNAALLVAMLQYMTFAASSPSKGQLIQMTAPIRRRIMDELHISRQTMYKDLKQLERCNVIHKIGDGAWHVNPSLIAKGSWRDVSALKLVYDLRLDNEYGTHMTSASATTITELQDGEIITNDVPINTDENDETEE